MLLLLIKIDFKFPQPEDQNVDLPTKLLEVWKTIPALRINAAKYKAQKYERNIKILSILILSIILY